jgi:hypothetical protein
VSEKYYKLNPEGIKARNEMLLLLDIKPRITGKRKGTFDVSYIKYKFLCTTLDRDKVLTPLLSTHDKSRPVSISKIEEFFVLVLERIAADYRQKTNRQSRDEKILGQLTYPILSNQRLQEYLIACINDDIKTKDKWEFPIDNLLKKDSFTPDSYKPTYSDISNVKKKNNLNHPVLASTIEDFAPSNVKTDGKNNIKSIINLFWNLDYKQERIFEDALEQNAQCASFSIAAPCETTQRWLLNRLIRHIPNINDASIFRPFDLSRHPMRNNFYFFWDDLSTALGTEPIQDNDDTIRGQNDIIRELCYREVEHPTILIIYNFQDDQNVQGKIVQDFWEKVTKEIKASNKRTESSRLILFFIDKCSPVYSSAQVINLDPLENISQSDVNSWLHKPVVFNWWQSQFEQSFASDLINECFNQENNICTPRSILDRICFKFGLKNGIVEIEQSWKWTYDKRTD